MVAVVVVVEGKVVVVVAVVEEVGAVGEGKVVAVVAEATWWLRGAMVLLTFQEINFESDPKGYFDNLHGSGQGSK